MTRQEAKQQAMGGKQGAVPAIIETDGLIFDIDGTLWDSRQTVAKAWNEVIGKYDPGREELDAGFLTGLFGKPMDEIAKALFPDLQGEELERMAGRCFDYENELLYTQPGKVYPGVRETVEQLAEHFPLFIVSNCQKGYIEVCMKGCGIEASITDYLCYGDTKAPKSGTLKRLIARNGLKKPVYVGDTQGDADACEEAGIPMIYAAYGLGKVENPQIMIRSFSELSKLPFKLFPSCR